MSITQTAEVPVSHRLTIDVPREIPAGRTIITFTPAKKPQERSYDTAPLPGAVTALLRKPCKPQRKRPPTLTASQFPGFLESIREFLAVTALLTRGLSVMNGINIAFDTCMELLSKRDMTYDEELDIQEFLDALTIIPLNETIEKKAVEIRRAASVKLPDSIVAATSIVLNAVLLTDDHHLLNLSWPGLRTQKIS